VFGYNVFIIVIGEGDNRFQAGLKEEVYRMKGTQEGLFPLCKFDTIETCG
jgi:hypothetical protein